ncbi:hypothetical protein DFJ73DRAFT_564432 [Zopfochytrium polystomum]|nr:hypothetical protein DFJ73DRAFT_564432 [Zopfochytrium polystomum]
MPFKFGFSEERDEDNDAQPDNTPPQPDPSIATQVVPSQWVHPNSTKPVALTGELLKFPRGAHLFRRCASDVNFEVASETVAEGWLDQVVLEKTDIIDGVYEGGFKTWECALDLISFLEELDEDTWFRGKTVLELGCGSGLPGIYCMTKGARVDFQDYNREVIELITEPNVLLNSVASPSAVDSQLLFDAEVDLSKIGKDVRFICGDWGSQGSLPNYKPYDLVLASETIYSQQSHQRLYQLMKQSMARPHGKALMAAKSVYFGCSGSLRDFLLLVEADGELSVQTQKVFGDGVQRLIILFEWRQC